MKSKYDIPFESFGRVPVEVRITVGRARVCIDELLSLSQNSVVQLDRRVTDPVELFVGDKLIALGELEELDGDREGQLVVRIVRVTNGGD